MLLIWLVGTVVFLVRDIVKQNHFDRTSLNYPPSDRRDLIDLAGEYGSNFSLLVSSSISRPYTAGLFHPTIYLPDIELPEESWRTILRHEVQHIRSHDEAKKLFFLTIQALFWWNPLAHISRREIDTILELQCDDKVTAGMSKEEVDDYLNLLKTLKKRKTDRRIPVGASAMVWDQKELEARFAALQNAGFSRKKRPHVIMYTLLLSVFLSSYLLIVQPVRYATEAELFGDLSSTEEFDETEIAGNTSEMYIVFKNGNYYLYVGDSFVSAVDKEQLQNEPFISLPIVGG